MRPPNSMKVGSERQSQTHYLKTSSLSLVMFSRLVNTTCRGFLLSMGQVTPFNAILVSLACSTLANLAQHLLFILFSQKSTRVPVRFNISFKRQIFITTHCLINLLGRVNELEIRKVNFCCLIHTKYIS